MKDKATNSPPSSVRLVVLELSREEDGDEDLEDTPLNGHGRYDTQYGVRSIPKFQEPKELEECDHSYDCSKVGDGSHGGSELVGVRVKLSDQLAACQRRR